MPSIPIAPFGTYTPPWTGKAIIELARRSLLGRGSAKQATSAVIRRLTGNAVDITLWNCRARLHLDNGNEIKAILQPQRYDPVELNFLFDAMKHPDAVFVDIGANAGLYSVNIASRHPGPAKILAIEPNISMLKRAIANLTALNPEFSDKGMDIRTVHTALGDHTGMATLDVSHTDPGHARISESATESVEVPIQPLLDLVNANSIQQIDALKIDIEGYEDRVLVPFFADAPPSLYPKVIVIEANTQFWDVDCLELLRSKKYDESAATRNNRLFRRTIR